MLLLQLNTTQDKAHYFELRTEQNIYYCGYKRTRNRVKNSFIKKFFLIRFFS